MLVDRADGRQLDVVTAGPDTGTPLVFHYGTPGSPVPYQPMVDAATRLGLRTVLYARPGYGGSTPHPGRTVADAAADTAAVLDALGLDRFVTVGWSGGGPHAIACAALLPDRCAGVASIACVAPYGPPDLDWTEGMGPENVDEFGAAVAGEEALTRFLTPIVGDRSFVVASGVAEALGGLLSDVDRGYLTGEFAEFLAAMFRGALEQGPVGWRDDDLAFVADWGFPLEKAAGIAIWQGSEDRMVPYPHGRWLAAHLPGARAHLLPGEGHLSILVGRFAEILDDLVRHAA